MSLDVARHALLWCTVINFLFLLLWALLVIWAPDWLYGINARLFRLPVEQFYAVNYAGIVLYEMGIFLFNLVPCIALYIVGRASG